LGDSWRDWIFAHALQAEARRAIEGASAATVGPGNPPK
jgi:hypothetical protein